MVTMFPGVLDTAGTGAAAWSAEWRGTMFELVRRVDTGAGQSGGVGVG